MAEISRKELEEYKTAAERAVNRLKNVQLDMKEAMAAIKQTMEVSIASFGMAYVLARWGGPGASISVVGVPVELGVALVLKVVGFTGILDEYSSDAHNIGDGLLSVYLVKKGFQLGAPEGKPTTLAGSMAVGALPPHMHSGISDAELARAMAA